MRLLDVDEFRLNTFEGLHVLFKVFIFLYSRLGLAQFAHHIAGEVFIRGLQESAYRVQVGSTALQDLLSNPVLILAGHLGNVMQIDIPAVYEGEIDAILHAFRRLGFLEGENRSLEEHPDLVKHLAVPRLPLFILFNNLLDLLQGIGDREFPVDQPEKAVALMIEVVELLDEPVVHIVQVPLELLDLLVGSLVLIHLVDQGLCCRFQLQVSPGTRYLRIAQMDQLAGAVVVGGLNIFTVFHHVELAVLFVQHPILCPFRGKENGLLRRLFHIPVDVLGQCAYGIPHALIQGLCRVRKQGVFIVPASPHGARKGVSAENHLGMIGEVFVYIRAFILSFRYGHALDASKRQDLRPE